jgi:hypothetical protein
MAQPSSRDLITDSEEWKSDRHTVKSQVGTHTNRCISGEDRKGGHSERANKRKIHVSYVQVVAKVHLEVGLSRAQFSGHPASSSVGGAGQADGIGLAA